MIYTCRIYQMVRPDLNQKIAEIYKYMLDPVRQEQYVKNLIELSVIIHGGSL